MRFLYRRGKGATRRVMHLCAFDPRTGEPTMWPLCGYPQRYDTTINPPFRLGLPLCKRCAAGATTGGRRSEHLV